MSFIKINFINVGNRKILDNLFGTKKNFKKCSVYL